jgi:predicted DNA-binding transcriptional regulator YafY
LGELRVPYFDNRELSLNIFCFGANAKVIEPEALRAAVDNANETAASQYRRGLLGLSGFESGES